MSRSLSTAQTASQDASSAIHTLSIERSFKQLGSSKNGLSIATADERLHHYGLNELTREASSSVIQLLVSQFKSPLVWILAFALIVSVLLHEYVDAGIIGGIIVLNAVLGFVQEYQAERSIEALRKMASPKAKVLRSGSIKSIESSHVVPGDIVFVESGDKVPADGRIIEAHNLTVEEAALTGESAPVFKVSDPLPFTSVLAEQKNMLFSSTIIGRGRASYLVSSTGMNTQVGKIARLIQDSTEKQTPLQKKLQRLGSYLTVLVVAVAVVIFLAGIFSGQEISVMFLTAIALAVAAIPEGLPAVITISLALGVRRMVSRNALVRKLPSVETLGGVTVICTDKTGTLTHNQMTVTQLWTNDLTYSVTGSGYESVGNFSVQGEPASIQDLSLLLRIGALCNDASVEVTASKQDPVKIIGDPTEAALLVSAQKAGFDLKRLAKEFVREDEISFSSERKMMTTFHRVSKSGGRSTWYAFSKGSPGVILEKCDRIVLNGKVIRLTRAWRKKILEQNDAFAESQLRVLGFAYSDECNPQKYKDSAETSLIFVGLQAMIDPPREEVKQSLALCNQAGIRVIMITGDQLGTAKAIAKQLGLIGEAIEGKELDNLNTSQLKRLVAKTAVFARVNPEHKLRIVTALQSSGQVVAMTGDGVNDAPALKKADIGISMGISGTDVAKEAADMILIDDNFSSIVSAIEEGRGIFDNIRKFVNYLLSSNLGEVGVLLFASLLGMPLPLTAIQILWINLVTDGLPATALSFDGHSKDTMAKAPRDVKEHIISKQIAKRILFMGFSISILSVLLFWLYQGSGLVKAQSIVFTSLVVFEVSRLHMIRSRYGLSFFSNFFLLAAIGFSILLQLLVLYTPLARFFGVVPLELADWGVILLAALLLFIISWINDFMFSLVSRLKVSKTS